MHYGALWKSGGHIRRTESIDSWKLNGSLWLPAMQFNLQSITILVTMTAMHVYIAYGLPPAEPCKSPLSLALLTFLNIEKVLTLLWTIWALKAIALSDCSFSRP